MIAARAFGGSSAPLIKSVLTAEIMGLRVIAGAARGRVLRAPRGRATRPTSGLVRGALSNMLEARGWLAGARVLECFAGSGALGIEALSRGAREVIFIEAAPAAVRTIGANLRASGFEDRARILPWEVGRALRLLGREGTRVDGVLADPPYGGEWPTRLLRAVTESGVLADRAWVAFEHGASENLHVPEPWVVVAVRRHGGTAVTLLVRGEAMS